MSWMLRENVEDAIAAYLRTLLPGDMRVYVARDIDPLQYPNAQVIYRSGENVDGSGLINGRRRMQIGINVESEAVPAMENGQTQVTSRRVHAICCEPVFSALARNDLHDALNDIGQQGVLFSMANIEGDAFAIIDRVFVTSFILDVIAQPCAIE